MLCPTHPSSPIGLYQQIFFQFPLILLGDGFTFLYLCQVMANKMELRSTDKSQKTGRHWGISVNTLSPFLPDSPSSPTGQVLPCQPLAHIPAVPGWGSPQAALCRKASPHEYNHKSTHRNGSQCQSPWGNKMDTAPRYPGGWNTGSKLWSLSRALGTDPQRSPSSSPVVIAAVLEVDQHKSISIFWL